MKDRTPRPGNPAFLADLSSVRQPKILTPLASASSLVRLPRRNATPAPRPRRTGCLTSLESDAGLLPWITAGGPPGRAGGGAGPPARPGGCGGAPRPAARGDGPSGAAPPRPRRGDGGPGTAVADRVLTLCHVPAGLAGHAAGTAGSFWAAAGTRRGAGDGVDGAQGGCRDLGGRGAGGNPVAHFRVAIFIDPEFSVMLAGRAEGGG